jgi:hypothetical protein
MEVSYMRHQNVPHKSTIADLIVETEAGKKLIAEIKAREEMEVQAREKAMAKAAERAGMLMELAAEVFVHQLRQDWVFETACNHARFTAVGWGDCCDKIAKDIKAACYSSAAYVRAVETLTEGPCRVVPPIVYRNQKLYR